MVVDELIDDVPLAADAAEMRERVLRVLLDEAVDLGAVTCLRRFGELEGDG